MKVGQPSSGPISNEPSASKGSGRAGSAQDVKEQRRADRAAVEKKSTPGANTEISQKSRELAQVKAAATEAPDVREDKVADLKRRIAEGSYHVDSHAVADRLVDEHLRMPG